MSASPADGVEWSLCGFDALDPRTLHDLLRLRVDVFVVEQACAYAEIDGLDVLPGTRHLVGRAAGVLVACARGLAPGAHPHAGQEVTRIGRVVVAPGWRGCGLAAIMLERLIDDLLVRHPGLPTELAAQVRAERVYAAAGFVRCSAPYLEDGIEHVDMRRAPPPMSPSR